VEAITRAYDYGADWVETDFNLMPDGKMLCFHDPKTRDRVIKPPFHVPTLEEVLAVVPKDRHIQCEIKTYGAEYAAKFDAAVKAAGLTPDNIIVSCFNPTSLKDFKRRMPQYRTLWLISPKRLDNEGKGIEVGRLIATAKDIGAFAMCPGAKGAYKAKWSRADADRIRAAGFSFRFFGVNTPQMLAYAAELGVEAFTCNYYEDAFLWARKNDVRLNPPKERKVNHIDKTTGKGI
jgi:glycerophosphoryl diester phosphodiesterase